MNKNFTLELPNFEGPLDLLLHLIRSNKLDIYDIPIAQITEQYLDYLEKMKKLNLKIAGEYFVMASTLLKIKSQDLLPKNDFEDPEIEEIDPREDLVEQLVQYSVFKKISQYFKKRNEEVPITAAKEPTISDSHKIQPLPLGQITVEELSSTFNLLMQRFKMRQQDNVQMKVKKRNDKEIKQVLNQKLKTHKQVSFLAVALNFNTLGDAISLFLITLEMCKNKIIRIKQMDDSDLILERVV